MPGLEPEYRQEGGWTLIEVRLSTLRQLFNSLDPSPFHERDLDEDAEEYIVGAAAEIAASAALKLVIHLPGDELEQARQPDVEAALQHYFDYRLRVERHRLAMLLREGRLALASGAVFLAVCNLLAETARHLPWEQLGALLGEGLVIIGWVALWRPAEIFLYDWWPHRRRCRLLARLAAMPVELRDAG